ncbi:solute carrier organic anion transporter family member 1A2-like isoform X2 [Carettochelys insculpta]|uniref:solute carrier organic anion transporter family member 1A2-like isoform X2 n=1 Tax=Carettochelys insculpta TaxID=44489 RepID=UPI003EB877FE
MTGSYMKSIVTQIERRFNIPASLVGFINGSFEIECEQKSRSLMWVFVLVGNVIRGIGETPIIPLGISYVEDFSKAENSPFYIACLQVATVIGAFLGYMLGSYCAELYVDLGFTDIEDVTITLTDARWVGAWWLGILMCGSVTLLTAIPFCFLPKSLPKEGQVRDTELLSSRSASQPQERDETQHKFRMNELTKDFIPFLRSLFYNTVYMLFILISVLQFSAFIGMISFMPKYLEQQYGKSASQALYLLGVYSLPIISAGYFLGGLLMKKFKINTFQAANIAFWISLTEYLIFFTAFYTVCENVPVAGLTVSYEGIEQLSYMETSLISDCNNDCDCSTKVWDPVCGENGITYISPCLAGCRASDGTRKHTVFENCTCVAASGFSSGNVSAVLGQCEKGAECDMMLTYFLVLLLVCNFIFSFGAMPGYMVFIRSIKPEEKSLGVGIHTLATRVLGGIPSPIYFGALIDTTCLKWGSTKCGGKGACRLYDVVTYRRLNLGLPAILHGVSYFPCVLILLFLKKQFKSSEGKTFKSLPMAVEAIEEQND